VNEGVDRTDQPPPTVNVGAGIGLAGRYHGFEWPSTVLLSAQFPVARFVVVEVRADRHLIYLSGSGGSIAVKPRLSFLSCSSIGLRNP
jgi:hypothetical protein